MAKALGSDSVLKVAGNDLGNLKSVTFGGTVTAVDATDNDSSGIKEYLAGDEDGTCSATYNYDPSDTAQAALITNFYAKTETTFVYQPTVGSGLKQYTFQGVITGLNFPSTHEVTLEASCDIQITAGVTAANQA
jgi:hypothetical protein